MLKNKTNQDNNMDQEQIALIIKALRNNPRGMTVTQISKEIDLNRNSVAKYLEVLLISGHVEMKSYGPAKVFYLSQRVPMSTMLDFSSDYILILDRDLKIIQINNNFTDLIKTKKETTLGQKIQDIPIQIFKTPEMATKLKDALDGKGTNQKIELTTNKQKHYFNIKLISTTFEDGLPGVTIILENITELKKLEKTLQETNQLNQTILQNISDSVIVLDQKQKIISANNATADLLQTPKEKIQQKKLTDLLAGFEKTLLSKTIKNVTKTGKPETITDEYAFANNQKGLYKTKVIPVKEGILCIIQKATN
ncbi:MAG: hypothetical protein CW691_02660 [Candidatus Bathyarchaeum sp.]|nr:MAG: hypothetical protein CW691_02660 [Candidatus Bathyarchaeum sp.]